MLCVQYLFVHKTQFEMNMFFESEKIIKINLKSFPAFVNI
jgi:hypothetical protein